VPDPGSGRDATAGTSPVEAREYFVDTISGLELNQAGLFPRNTGYSTDLAVLDVHVMRFMGGTT